MQMARQRSTNHTMLTMGQDFCKRLMDIVCCTSFQLRCSNSRDDFCSTIDRHSQQTAPRHRQRRRSSHCFHRRDCCSFQQVSEARFSLGESRFFGRVVPFDQKLVAIFLQTFGGRVSKQSLRHESETLLIRIALLRKTGLAELKLSRRERKVAKY
jgi:hypothetical protein